MKLEQLKKMIREVAKKEMNLVAVQNTQKSLKLESASRTAMEIGGLTGLNKDAVQKFVDTHNLDIEKVFQFVKKGKLSDRMDFVTAVSGKPNNPIQKKIIKKLQESVKKEIKVGQMVKVVDNPHWEAALGKKGPFKRKVKMIDGDNVFFTDGSNSSMKYIKESVNETLINEADLLMEAVDMAELEFNLKRIKKENPGKKVTYFFTKDDPKGYKIQIKEESVKESIKAFDERSFGKNGIIIMIDDNGKKVSAIFKNRKNADKYNRNKPEDLKTLVSLANKKGFGKAIDESVNEGKYDATLDKIEAAVKNASSFMNIGAELKKAGIKYDFSTEMIPMYIIKVSGNTIAIVNKKYAAGAEREVGNYAIVLMKFQNLVKEATNLAKMMAGIKKGSQTGPWTIVVSFNKKVYYQTQVKTKNEIPAKFEHMKKVTNIPGYIFTIEDNTGMTVYSEKLLNEAKKYDIGSGYLGNGLTIWNRAEEKDGDYETIAHIGKDGKLTIYDKEIPADIKKMIGIWATSMKKGNRPGSY